MRKKIKPQMNLFCHYNSHKFSKELSVISAILDDTPEVLDWVHHDLVSGTCKNYRVGACGMTAEQVLRAAILKQRESYSYEMLAFQLIDSDSTKSFVRLDEGEVFGKSCLQENIIKITDATWEKINDRLVVWAKDEKIERGRVVRTDSTVVESNIHAPTDSTLLHDCVRVVARELKKIRQLSPEIGIYPYFSPKNSKKLALKIVNSKNNEVRKPHYEKLLKGCRYLRTQISTYIAELNGAKLDSNISTKITRSLVEMQRILPLFEAVIWQTDQRIIKGKQVTSDKKIVSIFEEHTDIIVKGRRTVEYGHKIFVTSGASNLITDIRIEDGNPSDCTNFLPTIEKQIKLYGRAPRQTSADGGFASQENVSKAKKLGVSDVCFSKRCGLKITEMVKSAWVFHKLRDFRAGIEGIISVLKRAFGLSRCLWEKKDGFKKYVKSRVVAFNLTVLARHKLEASG